MKQQMKKGLQKLKLRRRKGPKPNYPPLSINNPEYNQRQTDFATNAVSTTKYNFLNFLPKVLFEQFRKTTNFYFLLIVIIVLIPPVSPLTPGPSVAGLVFVLGVSMLREAYEDIKRFREDRKVNLRMFDTILPDSGTVRQRLSKDIRVGDLVHLRNDQPVPADMILLASALQDGVGYVETSQLDGETNLKLKRALPQTSSLTIEELARLKGQVAVEPPNHHLYGFQGKMTLENQDYPLGDEQLLVRTTFLRNTPWAVGVVVYAGPDTKSALNQKPPPSKFSSLDIRLNKAVIFIFLLKITLCFLMAILGGVWEQKDASDSWYVGSDTDAPAVWGIKIFFGFFALMSYFIPLSLAVSLEIVKVYQALTMNWDEKMATDKTNVGDSGMIVKTSNLNDELALVKYVFSDKTGTLTENKMEFRRATINGVLYDEAGSGQVLSAIQNATDKNGVAFEFEFLRMLAVCHTVVSTKGENGELDYKASSPDEEALVKGARANGVTYFQRTNDGTLIRVLDHEELYPTLCVMEFTSARRRMSIVVQTPDGRIVLFTKGADSVIYERLAPGQDDLKARTLQHLEDFSKIGLRTLAIGYKQLDPNNFQQFMAAYNQAANIIGNREEEVEKVCDVFERDLMLLGGTAIEDKLQQYVPETIESLLRAGINVWVITGDKQATAINIGYSCRLLTPDMDVVKINAETTEECKKLLEQAVGKYCQPTFQGQVAMVVDGVTLKFAINEHAAIFLEFAKRCKSVVCNRVTPIQKAKVVKLVRDSTKTVTLAIGDGANDVSMIQEAHVGVGIFGNEGTQAARSADFAIRLFFHLKRLLMVHGRYSLIRNAGLIQYSFYKNIAVFTCQFWFSFFNAWSTQTIYNAYIMMIYNIIITSLPPLFYGAFEKDLSEDIIEENPEAYRVLRLFSYPNLGLWILAAFYHSLVFFFGGFILWNGAGSALYGSSGQVADLFVFGNLIITVGTVTVLLKIALETKYWTAWIHVGIWGSMIAFFLMLLMLSPLDPEQYLIFVDLFRLPAYWFWIPVGVVMALIPDFVLKYLERTYFPKEWHILQEQYRFGHRPSAVDPHETGKEMVLI